MSKERLEEIKTSTWNICECETCYCENFKPHMIAVDPKHFEWLIEQAERVEELEKDKNEYIRWWKDEARLGNELRDENQRYKKALERIVYEDISGWSSQDILGKVIDIAHEALEGESE